MLVLKIAAGTLLAAAVLTGCTIEDNTGSSSDDPAVVDNSSESRPGSQAVYARIESLNDCVALQREFDVAMDNVDRYPGGDDRRTVPFAYARAADARMKEVGCYG